MILIDLTDTKLIPLTERVAIEKNDILDRYEIRHGSDVMIDGSFEDMCELMHRLIYAFKHNRCEIFDFGIEFGHMRNEQKEADND